MKIFTPLAALLTAAHQIHARIVSEYLDDKCSSTSLFDIKDDEVACEVLDCVEVHSFVGTKYQKVACPTPAVEFDAFVATVLGEAPHVRFVKYENDDCTGAERSSVRPLPSPCVVDGRYVPRTDGTLFWAVYSDANCTGEIRTVYRIPLDECDSGEMAKLENAATKADPFYTATAFHASSACSKATHAYLVQSLLTDVQKTDAQLGATCAATPDAANVFSKTTHVATLDAGLTALFGDIPFMKVTSHFDDDCEIEDKVTVYRADGSCIPQEDGASSVKATLTEALYTFKEYANAECSGSASSNYTVAQTEWANCTDKRTFEYNAAAPSPEATPAATNASANTTTQTPTPAPSGTAIAAVAAIAAVLPVVVAFFQ